MATLRPNTAVKTRPAGDFTDSYGVPYSLPERPHIEPRIVCQMMDELRDLLLSAPVRR